MKFSKRGFTLVEVALFLALSGALFAMVTIGVSNSVYQQRFNDAVQDFAEFLKDVYSGVENVQNSNIGSGGRSERAIYGKLVVFGASEDLTGKNNDGGAVFVYDVVGDATKTNESDLIKALRTVNVGVFETKTIDGVEFYDFVGSQEKYTPKWGSSIQKVEINENYVGALLVVRHPRSGSINTLVYNGTGLQGINDDTIYNRQNILLTALSSDGADGGFKRDQNADFCISLDESTEGMRRDVQIVKNATNASGVNIIATEDNPCRQ